MHAYNGVLTILGLACFFVFCVSVKVEISVSLLYRLNLPFHYYVFVCILPEKAIPEMTYTVLGGTLNPTHSLTQADLCSATI